MIEIFGALYGNRTRVFAVKERYPDADGHQEIRNYRLLSTDYRTRVLDCPPAFPHNLSVRKLDMPRAVRNAKIDTRSARAKLTARREPYWTVISIGYRRGAKGGTWVARWRGEDGKQTYEALGAADDARDAYGSSVQSFAQAQEAARGWFFKKGRNQAGHGPDHEGPCTVATALADYFAAREQRESKGVLADRSIASARIEPELGNVNIDRLTTKRIRDWHADLAKAPKIVRSRHASIERATKPYDLGDPEAVRARRSTANRQLTVLKAALNHAFSEQRAASDAAWRIVKPFRETDSAIVHFLSANEVMRLVESCRPHFAISFAGRWSPDVDTANSHAWSRQTSMPGLEWSLFEPATRANPAMSL